MESYLYIEIAEVDYMDTRFYFHKLHVQDKTNTDLITLFDTIKTETKHETNPPHYIQGSESRQHIQILIQKSREYKGKDYTNFWIVIPNKFIEKLKWRTGDDLEAEVKGDKLIIDKD